MKRKFILPFCFLAGLLLPACASDPYELPKDSPNTSEIEGKAPQPYVTDFNYTAQGNQYFCIWSVDGRRGGLWCERVNP